MSTWESLAGWGVPELPWLPGAKQGAFPCVPLRDLRPSLHLCSLHGLTPRSSCLSSFPREGPHRPCPLGPLATGPVSAIADPSRTATASPRALPGPTAWQVPCLPMDPDRTLSGGCFGGLVCAVARAAGPPCAPGLDLLAAFHCGSGLPREKEPCAGQGQCLTLLDPARLAHGLGLAQYSGNSQ